MRKLAEYYFAEDLLPKKKKNGKNGKNGEEKKPKVPNDLFECSKCGRYYIVYIISEVPDKIRCKNCGGMLRDVPPMQQCLENYRIGYDNGSKYNHDSYGRGDDNRQVA